VVEAQHPLFGLIVLNCHNDQLIQCQNHLIQCYDQLRFLFHLLY
jgi:hypothetical protein